MLTIVHLIPVTMAVHVLTGMAGRCVPVRLASPDQFAKSTSTSVTRPRAVMGQHVEIKSTALNASVLQESLDNVVKVRLRNLSSKKESTSNKMSSTDNLDLGVV